MSGTTTLLHGWGMNGQVFAPLCQALSAPSNCYCPQLPGYTGSPWPFHADFELQLAMMGDDLPDGRLVGWSMGGLFAIELARRYPQRFDEVVLLACNPCFVMRPDWSCAIEASVLDAFQADLELDWQRTLKRFLALQMQGEADARQLVRKLWQMLVGAEPSGIDVLRFGLELLRSHDARHSLSQLEQPLRLILGESDPLVPLTMGKQIADVGQRIEVESLAGASHAPFLSNPAAVAARLKTFSESAAD